MWIRLRDNETTRVNLDNVDYFKSELVDNRIIFNYGSSSKACVYDDREVLKRDVERIEKKTNISIEI